MLSWLTRVGGGGSLVLTLESLICTTWNLRFTMSHFVINNLRINANIYLYVPHQKSIQSFDSNDYSSKFHYEIHPEIVPRVSLPMLTNWKVLTSCLAEWVDRLYPTNTRRVQLNGVPWPSTWIDSCTSIWACIWRVSLGTRILPLLECW